jgi:hypothetical protein
MASRQGFGQPTSLPKSVGIVVDETTVLLDLKYNTVILNLVNIKGVYILVRVGKSFFTYFPTESFTHLQFPSLFMRFKLKVVEIQVAVKRRTKTQ